MGIKFFLLKAKYIMNLFKKGREKEILIILVSTLYDSSTERSLFLRINPYSIVPIINKSKGKGKERENVLMSTDKK